MRMNKAKYSVEKMCVMLGVGRSSYYDWLRRNTEITKPINIDQDIISEFNSSKKTYGSPRISEALNQRGIIVSKSTVARVMKKLGIQARPRRRYIHTTDSNHNYMIFDNVLNRLFYSEKVNEKWVSDITYIPTKNGWTYLTIIMDLADKMIVGWNLSKDMTAQNTTIACIKMALHKRKIKNKLIFHSDRGVQYCCSEFRNVLRTHKTIVQSMSRKGNCWDNAPAESFFKTLKTEWTKKFYYSTIEDARNSIFDYIERWYNTKRKHSAIGYKAPLQQHYFLTNTAA